MMTDSTQPKRLRPELQAWFDAWKNCTQNVLSQVAGLPHDFELSAEAVVVADSDLRYIVVAAGAIQGEMALRIAQDSAIRLAHKFLGDAAAPTFDSITNDDREALEELLRQITGLVATAVAPIARGEVQLQISRAEAPWVSASDVTISLRTHDEEGTEIALGVLISPALCGALAAQSSVASTDSSSVASQSSSVAAAVALNSHASGYRRLLDVGLGVKLRFGTRRMLLRDVLALSSGLVVELDNTLNSPVDLLLDGRVIARGDVVVIDGKYGLRVADVVEPSSSVGSAI